MASAGWLAEPLARSGDGSATAGVEGIGAFEPTAEAGLAFSAAGFGGAPIAGRALRSGGGMAAAKRSGGGPMTAR